MSKKRIIRELKRLSNHIFKTNYPLNSTNFFEEDVLIDKSVVLMNNIKIGRGTYIRRDVFIDDCATIGRYCSIANDAVIAPSEHPLKYFSTHPISYSIKDYPGKELETIIGNDVWIGTRAIIKRGVKIGDGSVIGAGAIVTKDIEPYGIATGIPAKIIKYRFEEPIRKELLLLKWWELPEEKLRDLKELPIEEVIAKLKIIKSQL